MYIDHWRLLRLAFAGAMAGLFVYCVFNPSYAREEALGHEFAFGEDIATMMVNAILQTLVLSAAFSVMLGGMLVLADEYSSPPKRVAFRMGLVTASGAAVGAIAGVIAQCLYVAISIATLGIGQIAARGIGWAAMGAGAGICVGYVLGGWKRARMSMLGGFAGGLAGGLVFDVVALITEGGSASRFVGFILIGLATGAAVALVEDIAKRSWITVLNGPKEGRSFILTKPTTSVGRDELADIPLFGDASVAKQHACLMMQGNIVTLQGIGGAVAVNGAAAQMTVLRPWDVVSVGRWTLRFHQKGSQPMFRDFHSAQIPKHKMAYFGQPLPDLASPQYQPSYTPTNVTTSQPAVRTATGNLALVVVAGPHLNQRFSFGPGTVRVGREVGCGVLLAQDGVVSRNHAEMAWDGSSWVVRDLGSRNGLWVNGVQVTEHALNVGDQIGVGQTSLKVEGL